jgi:hypothetical protein
MRAGDVVWVIPGRGWSKWVEDKWTHDPCLFICRHEHNLAWGKLSDINGNIICSPGSGIPGEFDICDLRKDEFLTAVRRNKRRKINRSKQLDTERKESPLETTSD